MQPAASSITTKLTTPFHNILSIHHSLLPLLSSSASPSLRPLSPSPSPPCHVFHSSPLWSFLLTFKPTFAFGRQPSSIFTSASFPIFSTYLEFAPACPSARSSSSHLSFTIRPNFVFHFFFLNVSFGAQHPQFCFGAFAFWEHPAVVSDAPISVLGISNSWIISTVFILTVFYLKSSRRLAQSPDWVSKISSYMLL